MVLCGASGSGKSTFARCHFVSTEAVSSDYCRALVSDDETDQSSTAAAFELLHHIIDKRLKFGRLAVVNANVKTEDRKGLLELPSVGSAGHRHRVRSAGGCVPGPQRAAKRIGRTPVHAIKRHAPPRQAVGRERFTGVYTLGSTEELDAVEVVRTRLWSDRRDDTGPFDSIGDVHGCHTELMRLLDRLGYDTAADPITHPESRRGGLRRRSRRPGPAVTEVLDVARGSWTCWGNWPAPRWIGVL